MPLKWTKSRFVLDIVSNVSSSYSGFLSLSHLFLILHFSLPPTLCYSCSLTVSSTEADQILRWPQSWNCTKIPLLLFLLLFLPPICFNPNSSSSCAVSANCLQGGNPSYQVLTVCTQRCTHSQRISIVAFCHVYLQSWIHDFRGHYTELHVFPGESV